ncbi:Leukocyte elastase inhibitor [Merluccius polli]|uniref:Leukocyte elastase inhibitor n=1 Tax=Merluccius polli TaxID=89951 RepID=A0AA47NA76_MERPO|nr:Leukocyte elastase inhibitor [Merluccius polli]
MAFWQKGLSPRGPHAHAAMAALGSTNAVFALDMFRCLSQASPSGNVFFSPLSVSSALAMVYLGAKGDTASQMQKTLSFSSEDVHTDFQTLNADINSPSSAFILKLANRLYGENTAHFLPVSVVFIPKYMIALIL